jgi:hypothetical protein
MKAGTESVTEPTTSANRMTLACSTNPLNLFRLVARSIDVQLIGRS